MLITVTADHIAQGRKCAAHACPLYMAIAEKVKFRQLSVGPGYADIAGFGMVELPSEAERFRNDFDHGRTVQPFAFELDLGKVIQWPSRWEGDVNDGDANRGTQGAGNRPGVRPVQTGTTP